MKNLLISLITFISFTAVAQKDGYNQDDAHYKRIKSATTNMSIATADKLGLDISGKSKYAYSYLKRLEKDSSLVVIYQLDEIELRNYRSYENLTYWFSTDYTLRKISGNKRTMIAIWNSFFLPNAPLHKILTNYRYRVLQSNKYRLHYQLSGKGDQWEILNRYRESLRRKN